MTTDFRHAALLLRENEDGEVIEAELYLMVEDKPVAKQNITNTSIVEFVRKHEERGNMQNFAVIASEDADACDDYEGAQEQGFLIDNELFDQAKADYDAGIIVTPQNQHVFYFDEIKTAVYSKDVTKKFIPQAPNDDVLESTSALGDFFQTDPDTVPEAIRAELEQEMREDAVGDTSVGVLDADPIAPMESEDAIDTQVLKAIEFKYGPHVEVSPSLVTEEFMSLYPGNGLPDRGRLTITYVPGSAIIDMKSLKYYITSFGKVGIRGERAVQKICIDLGKLVEPQSLEVEIKFNPRGGFTNTVVAKYVNDTEEV